MWVHLLTTLNNIIKAIFLTLSSVFHLYLRWDGQIRPQDLVMALDRSFGLHVICVRVGAGHKERGHKNGVSFRIHGLYG